MVGMIEQNELGADDMVRLFWIFEYRAYLWAFFVQKKIRKEQNNSNDRMSQATLLVIFSLSLSLQQR
jgi:hypothetical protein